MNTYQHKLINALNELETVQQDAWKEVIRATNDLVRAIQDDQENIDQELLVELEKRVDAPALKTAWIYGRLEHAVASRRGTADRIRTILGYKPTS